MVLKNWQGLDASRTGLPGNANIVNNKYKNQQNSQA